MEIAGARGGARFRRARGTLSIGAALVLLAMTLTLTGAVPASAASCVPGPGANLKSCNLSKANLYGVNLTGANLTSANLTGANLTNANLTNANLTSATATGADLQGALISNATLTSAGMKNTLLDQTTLEGSNVTGATFSGSDFTGLVSGTDTGSGTLPSSWSLVSGYLVGPGANLTDAALADADLTGANLTGANLTGADVDGAILPGAILSGVISGGLIGTPNSLPANWSVVSGYLVGPDAFLYGANLGGADLTGADLFGANIEGAVLTGATLTDANLENVDAMAVLLSNSNLAGTNLAGANLVDVTSGGITGTPATLPKTTPTNWQFVDGYLVGPYANLTGADLAGQYLASGNLDGANLTDSDLSDSDLTNAYVTDAVMTGTNLADATLAGITSHNVVGTPAALPSGWELVGGILKPIPPAPGAGSTTKISSAQAAPQVAAAPKAETASKVTAAPRATTPRTTTSLQLGIDVYTTDNCEPASVWQANATNEMKGIKSLGANTVQIVFPFYTTAPNASTLFSADLCGEPEANPVPLQSPSPARLAVLVHAGQAAGLHVMLRPLLDQSNIYIFGDWRGNIKPTNKSAWMTSYEAVLKPYLEMAQANKVTRFAISSELTSLSSSLQWPSVIASAKKLYSGQLTFDSSWVAPLAGAVHAGTAVAQDAYPDIPHSSATTTVAQLLAGWNTYLKAEPLAAPAASDVFEEVGITAIDGTYAKPNIAPPPGGTFNQAIQANWFTAACEFVKQHKIGGVYFWGPQFYYNFGNLITKPDPGQASELQPASQTAIRKCFA